MLNGITGVANFMFLPNDPSEVGLDPVEKKAPGAPAGGGGSIGFMQALKIPNVMGYALAFGFFKFINYAMFFWLPFFLSLHFDSESANVVSSLYSVGMMPGGVIVGVVSDLYDGRRACVIATFMCALPLTPDPGPGPRPRPGPCPRPSPD